MDEPNDSPITRLLNEAADVSAALDHDRLVRGDSYGAGDHHALLLMLIARLDRISNELRSLTAAVRPRANP
jgi:hypothetical protein